MSFAATAIRSNLAASRAAANRITPAQVLAIRRAAATRPGGLSPAQLAAIRQRLQVLQGMRAQVAAAPVPVPRLSWRREGDVLVTELRVELAPGQVMRLESRVDLKTIAAAMRRDPQVAGIFGDIWGGIKSAVGTVAKAVGADKVLKLASPILKNPIVQAVVPGASLASKGVDIARSLVAAKGAALKGDPRAKAAVLQAHNAAAAIASRGGPSTPTEAAVKNAVDTVSRIYRIQVTPL